MVDAHVAQKISLYALFRNRDVNAVATVASAVVAAADSAAAAVAAAIVYAVWF